MTKILEMTNTPVKAVFFASGGLAVIVLLTSLIVGNSIFVGPVASIAFILVGFLAASSRPDLAPVGAAVALMGQAIGFTASFQGHGWQIDSHMLFFALLAGLVALRSIPALLVATAITAVHHLSLTLVLPSLVYPTSEFVENLGRTVFHAVIVLMETAVLVLTVSYLKSLEARMRDQTKQLEVSLEEAEHASHASEMASAQLATKSDELAASLQEAEAARQEAEEARQDAQVLKEQAEEAKSHAEKLLLESKNAAEERELANREREEAQLEAARQQQSKAEEQNQVVETVNVALERLRAGDLTVRIDAWMPKAYEGVRDSFNAATETLENLVSEVLERSLSIESEVKEVVASASDLAVRTERQAMTLSEATNDLSALSEKAKLVFHAVEDATASAKQANSSACSSEKIVGEASSVMNSVQAESQEISKIVQVIDELAFQTNLLALNAGVEAARAGEAGLGFSVVASEVRALAQRSADSATEIRDVIERSGAEVERGTVKISESVASLATVLESVSAITEKSSVISVSTKEQGNAVQELNAKIKELDDTTQKNAAMFEETSAACSTLLEATSALRKLTGRFQTGSSGKPQVVAA